MIWARAQSMPAFCAVANVRDAVALTHCQTAFFSADTVEIDEQPPHGMRCDDCVRVLVDRRCIELGLLELMSNAPVEATR